LFNKFKDAVKLDGSGNKTKDKVWPDAGKLKTLFKNEPKSFKNDFWAVEAVAHNYLTLLTTKGWHRRSYGNLDHSKVNGELPGSSCSGVIDPLFTPAELMRQLLKWRKAGKMKRGKAGIKHFMKYLKETQSGYRRFHSLVVDLGKPGKTRQPKDACSL
jgi:hypothetical protein